LIIFKSDLRCGYDHYAVTVRKKKKNSTLQQVTDFSHNNYLMEILLYTKGCDE